MKIVERTERRLELVHRPWPWLIGAYAVSGAAVWVATTSSQDAPTLRIVAWLSGAGLAAAATYMLPMSRTIFDRPGRTLTRVDRRLIGTRYRPIPLASVTGARVVPLVSARLPFRRVVIDCTAGRVPIDHSIDPYDRQTIANVINEWLEAG